MNKEALGVLCAAMTYAAAGCTLADGAGDAAGGAIGAGFGGGGGEDAEGRAAFPLPREEGEGGVAVPAFMPNSR